MSRTILAKMDGFTPVIDTVVEKTSLMTAVVFGRIWRFCQMKDGVCNASLDRIGQDIGIDKATAIYLPTCATIRILIETPEKQVYRWGYPVLQTATLVLHCATLVLQKVS
jgi:hypothetical protein